jgi:hypothetical protein
VERRRGDTRQAIAASFVGENASYSAARIGNIADITRDQVHVHVHAVLSGGLPDIDADVVTVRRMIGRNPALRAIEERLYFGLLPGGHVKKIRDVPPRYDQDMSTAQTVTIVANIGQRALNQDTFGPAQLAIRNRHGINPSQ